MYHQHTAYSDLEEILHSGNCGRHHIHARKVRAIMSSFSRYILSPGLSFRAWAWWRTEKPQKSASSFSPSRNNYTLDQSHLTPKLTLSSLLAPPYIRQICDDPIPTSLGHSPSYVPADMQRAPCFGLKRNGSSRDEVEVNMVVAVGTATSVRGDNL